MKAQVRASYVDELIQFIPDFFKHWALYILLALLFGCIALILLIQVPIEQQFKGQLYANEQPHFVTIPMGARLSTLLVENNQRVQYGDSLIKLIDTDGTETILKCDIKGKIFYWNKKTTFGFSQGDTVCLILPEITSYYCKFGMPLEVYAALDTNQDVDVKILNLTIPGINATVSPILEDNLYTCKVDFDSLNQRQLVNRVGVYQASVSINLSKGSKSLFSNMFLKKFKSVN
jgi:hypothetical protein